MQWKQGAVCARHSHQLFEPYYTISYTVENIFSNLKLTWLIVHAFLVVHCYASKFENVASPQVNNYASCVIFIPQTAGDALLDVLIGVTSPAGRLPNTWPASLDQVWILRSSSSSSSLPPSLPPSQVPDITDYTMVNRTYRYFQGDPLFPFGYGL